MKLGLKSISKSILSVTIALTLLMVMLPQAMASDDICQIGSSGYATLDEALAAVADGQTIKLLSEITHRSGIVVTGKKDHHQSQWL